MVFAGLLIDTKEFKEDGAISYMRARLKGGVDSSAETTRGGNLYKAFKSVLLPNEGTTLTMENYRRNPLEVDKLLEVLEDRLIGRFRHLFRKHGMKMSEKHDLHNWKPLTYNTIDGRFAQLAGTKSKPGPYPNVRTHFSITVSEEEIAGYDKRPAKHPRGHKRKVV